jgi:hypothetical protein
VCRQAIAGLVPQASYLLGSLAEELLVQESNPSVNVAINVLVASFSDLTQYVAQLAPQATLPGAYRVLPCTPDIYNADDAIEDAKPEAGECRDGLKFRHQGSFA